jgi:hypothetical protein
MRGYGAYPYGDYSPTKKWAILHLRLDSVCGLVHNHTNEISGSQNYGV